MQLHHSRNERELQGKMVKAVEREWESRTSTAPLFFWVVPLGGVHESGKQADVNSKSALQLAPTLLPPAIESVQNYYMGEKKVQNKSELSVWGEE